MAREHIYKKGARMSKPFPKTIGIILVILFIVGALTGVFPRSFPKNLHIAQSGANSAPNKMIIPEIRFPGTPSDPKCNNYQESFNRYSDAKVRTVSVDREKGVYDFIVHKDGEDLAEILLHRQTALSGEKVFNLYVERLGGIGPQMGVTTVSMLVFFNAAAPLLAQELGVKVAKIIWMEINNFDWGCLFSFYDLNPNNKIDVWGVEEILDEDVPYFEPILK